MIGKDTPIIAADMKRPNPLSPDQMTPAERRTALCAILALGLLRLRMKQSTALPQHIGERSLHYPPGQSGHATPTYRRIA